MIHCVNYSEQQPRRPLLDGPSGSTGYGPTSRGQALQEKSCSKLRTGLPVLPLPACCLIERCERCNLQPCFTASVCCKRHRIWLLVRGAVQTPASGHWSPVYCPHVPRCVPAACCACAQRLIHRVLLLACICSAMEESCRCLPTPPGLPGVPIAQLRPADAAPDGCCPGRMRDSRCLHEA